MQLGWQVFRGKQGSILQPDARSRGVITSNINPSLFWRHANATKVWLVSSPLFGGDIR